MKSNRIGFVLISLLVLLALAPVAFKFNWAAAQSGASSSTTPDQSTSPSASPASDQATTSSATASTPVVSVTPQTIVLALVHTAGMRYLDYCTNGTKLTVYPGDPATDSHLSE